MMEHRAAETRRANRPVVYDYGSAHEFFAALLGHYKATSGFSVRARTKLTPGCSPALVSQVLAGHRRLTRDQLPAFARIFKLTEFESEFIDKSLCGSSRLAATDFAPKQRRTHEPKNHILKSWLNVYVKDLVHLKGFTLNGLVLHKMLMGLASPKMIERSVDFLLREGFWRRTSSGTIVPEDPALISTNDIPNEKIRAFHKQALKVALRGLEAFPTDRRKAATVLVSIDREKFAELQSLIDSFQAQLLKFIEEHPSGSDELVQITMHLTPVGGKNV